MTQQLLTRRTLCGGVASVAALHTTALPTTAFAAGGSKNFDIVRDGQKIGEHSITVTPSGDGIRTSAATDIVAKAFGIVVYRYSLAYSETYDAERRLVSLEGKSAEGDKKRSVVAQRVGDLIDIAGTKYTGTVSADAVPTSYWLRRAAEVSPWISTQDGRLYPVTIRDVRAVEAPPETARSIQVSDNKKFIVDLFYDAQGEWIGTAFDARGERAIFRLRDSSGALNT